MPKRMKTDDEGACFYYLPVLASAFFAGIMMRSGEEENKTEQNTNAILIPVSSDLMGRFNEASPESRLKLKEDLSRLAEKEMQISFGAPAPDR